jgi:hypothetical protein
VIACAVTKAGFIIKVVKSVALRKGLRGKAKETKKPLETLPVIDPRVD